jgi:cytidylate kinase
MQQAEIRESGVPGITNKRLRKLAKKMGMDISDFLKPALRRIIDETHPRIMEEIDREIEMETKSKEA